MNYLAIDFGGTAIKYALMNEKAIILEKSSVATPGKLNHTIDDLMDVILKQYMSYIPTPKLTTCKFFNDANLVGALYHHLNK